MEKAIKYHLQNEIKQRIKLTGGMTFETWLLVLSDNKKVVFRTQCDFTTMGGRKIIISDVLEREKFFYENVNKNLGSVCPKVYVVDGTKQYYEHSFQIMEYIEGQKLRQYLKENPDEQTLKKVSRKIGEITANINQIKIDVTHPYVSKRDSWENYVAKRLHERLIGLVEYNVITPDEINKITKNMRNRKAEHTLSFLHLDMRHCNMIINNGEIFVLDAENCEFGDPLHELAAIDVGQECNDNLIEGYKSVFQNINLDSELYYYYKMERLGLVLGLYLTVLQNDIVGKELYLNEFYATKGRVL